MTQVVHMLFTRNHEKEVELEALKEAYEYEIELVLADAKKQLNKSYSLLQDEKQERAVLGEKLQGEADARVASLEEDWSKKVKWLEQELSDEKTDSNNCREQLQKAKLEIEKLQSGQSRDFQQLSRELSDKTKEVERLRNANRSFEKNLVDLQQKMASFGSLERNNEQLRKELEALRGVERMREQLSAKNKSLEQEVKLLRRELHRKSIDRTPPTSQANPTVRRTAPTPSNASRKI